MLKAIENKALKTEVYSIPVLKFEEVLVGTVKSGWLGYEPES